MNLRFSISSFLLVFLLLISTQAFCQAPFFTIPNNLTFKRLAASPNPEIRVIKASLYIKNILPITGIYRFYEQEVILLNHRIYIYLNASGLLYESQLGSINQDSLYFKRIDSTEHAGYNINCFPFVYNKNLYNIGGYGFWRWNGQLRQFITKSHEWDIVPLNQEVPIAKQESQPVIWQNMHKNQIMVLSFMQGNNAISSGIQHRTDTVMNLDLATKDWNVMGALNPDLAKTFPNNTLIANMDSGLLVNNTSAIEFWNLISNRVYKLKNTPYKHNLLSGYYRSCITWTEANKVLFGDPLLNATLDSVTISSNDFEQTDQQIFVQSKTSTPYYLGLFISILMVGGLGYSINRKNIIRNKEVKAHSLESKPLSSDLNSSYPKQQLFSTTESDLIRLIIKNINENNRYSNVDEINRVLGVGNKSMDMQKRKRSDVIKSINERYALVTNRSNVLLINRIKSEMDGRLYEFYISDEEASNVLKLIQ